MVSSIASTFLIQDAPGFTPQISRLVGMMNYARQTTLDAVRGLSARQLDYLHDSLSNPVGALLAHIAAVEVAYQVSTFDGRDFTREERQKWAAALELGQRARQEIRGRDLDYYLSALGEVRAKTLQEFSRRTDDWLYEQSPFWSNLPANNYFKWFHVMEDEINHRGQIRWLRRRVPNV